MRTLEEDGRGEQAPAPTPVGRSRRERQIDALGDPVNRELLGSMNDAPKSVQQLLDLVAVPKSTVYSRLHTLRELGLVAVQRTVISPEGKRTDLFRSLVEEARIEVRGSITSLHLRLRNLSEERLRELMTDLRSDTRS